MAAKITKIMAGNIEVMVDVDFCDGAASISLENYSIIITAKQDVFDLIEALNIAAKQLGWADVDEDLPTIEEITGLFTTNEGI